MPQPRPGKYFICCELNPAHRVLDLPSQHAHQQDGLIQAITGNGTEYQKWIIEPARLVPDAFTIRAHPISGKFVEPDRGTPARPLPKGSDRDSDGVLLCFFPPAESEYQCWFFEDAGPRDTYYIRNAATGKYWDLRAEDPSHIQQLTKKDMPHQRWILKALT